MEVFNNSHVFEPGWAPSKGIDWSYFDFQCPAKCQLHTADERFNGESHSISDSIASAYAELKLNISTWFQPRKVDFFKAFSNKNNTFVVWKAIHVHMAPVSSKQIIMVRLRLSFPVVWSGVWDNEHPPQKIMMPTKTLRWEMMKTSPQMFAISKPKHSWFCRVFLPSNQQSVPRVQKTGKSTDLRYFQPLRVSKTSLLNKIRVFNVKIFGPYQVILFFADLSPQGFSQPRHPFPRMFLGRCRRCWCGRRCWRDQRRLGGHGRHGGHAADARLGGRDLPGAKPFNHGRIMEGSFAFVEV